ELGQVAAELVEQLGGLLLSLCAAGACGARGLAAALAAPTGAGEHADDLVADLLRVGVEVDEDSRGDALVLAVEAVQDVPGADVVVLEGARFLLGEDDHLTGSFGEALEHQYCFLSAAAWVGPHSGMSIWWSCAVAVRDAEAPAPHSSAARASKMSGRRNSGMA